MAILDPERFRGVHIDRSDFEDSYYFGDWCSRIDCDVVDVASEGSAAKLDGLSSFENGFGKARMNRKERY